MGHALPCSAVTLNKGQQTSRCARSKLSDALRPPSAGSGQVRQFINDHQCLTKKPNAAQPKFRCNRPARTIPSIVKAWEFLVDWIITVYVRVPACRRSLSALRRVNDTLACRAQTIVLLVSLYLHLRPRRAQSGKHAAVRRGKRTPRLRSQGNPRRR